MSLSNNLFFVLRSIIRHGFSNERSDQLTVQQQINRVHRRRLLCCSRKLFLATQVKLHIHDERSLGQLICHVKKMEDGNNGDNPLIFLFPLVRQLSFVFFGFDTPFLRCLQSPHLQNLSTLVIKSRDPTPYRSTWGTDDHIPWLSLLSHLRCLVFHFQGHLNLSLNDLPAGLLHLEFIAFGDFKYPSATLNLLGVDQTLPPFLHTLILPDSSSFIQNPDLLGSCHHLHTFRSGGQFGPFKISSFPPRLRNLHLSNDNHDTIDLSKLTLLQTLNLATVSHLNDLILPSSLTSISLAANYLHPPLSCCSRLTHLRLSHPQGTLSLINLPDSLQTLRLASLFCHTDLPFSVRQLPHLRRLDLSQVKDQTFDQSHLISFLRPWVFSHLTRVKFPPRLLQHPDLSTFSCLIKISFGADGQFPGPLIPQFWPTSLNSLTLGRGFRSHLHSDSLPITLKILRLHHLSHLDDLIHLPLHLTFLFFDSPNSLSPRDLSCLPRQLLSLRLGHAISFQGAVIPHSLPPLLQELHWGRLCQPMFLDLGALPSSLLILILGDRFNHLLCHLPITLIYLELPHTCSFSIPHVPILRFRLGQKTVVTLQT